jgi:hypothetical protein
MPISCRRWLTQYVNTPYTEATCEQHENHRSRLPQHCEKCNRECCHHHGEGRSLPELPVGDSGSEPRDILVTRKIRAMSFYSIFNYRWW